MLGGEGPQGPVAITVEAKADESFGQLVSEALADAIDRGLEANTRGVDRVEEGQGAGPLPRVTGEPLFTSPAGLYLGKIVTRLRA